jgi:hypothetical protein
MTMKGKKHPPGCGHCSPETRAKISAARRGRGHPQSEETRAKIAAGLRKPDDQIEYAAAHARMWKYKERTNVCAGCGATDVKLDFALLREAKRTRVSKWGNGRRRFSTNFDDYVEMCAPCHQTYDRADA